MSTRNLILGAQLNERGVASRGMGNPITDRVMTPDISIYFASNGFSMHTFKEGQQSVFITADADELMAEIRSLVKRGERNGY